MENFGGKLKNRIQQPKKHRVSQYHDLFLVWRLFPGLNKFLL